jgi:excinuclease ABC subunit A
VFDVLAKLREKERVGDTEISGLGLFDQMITIEAKAKGLAAKHFSFNTKGGHCENCEGLGVITGKMLFL